MIFGIFLCTSARLQCSAAGILLAAVSSFCFSMRSILASAVLRTSQSTETNAQPLVGSNQKATRGRIGSFQLYVLMSFGGSTVVTAVFFTTELHGVWRSALYTPRVMGWTSRRMAVEGAGWWGVVDDEDPMRIVLQLFLAGMFHLFYNAASFQVHLIASAC
jgi:hypothetical protein